MPEPSNTISRPSASPSPADPAWDEAFLRVESYLRAHQLESRVLLNQLATEIIDEARRRKAMYPEEEPVTLAMQITHARIGSWFALAGTEGDGSNERDRTHSRLTLAIANLHGRWSDYFLSTEPLPPELTATMASFQFQPGPELRFSNMPPALLEFGLDEVYHQQIRQQGLWLLIHGAFSWLMVVGLISVAWAASH